jgi:hypothetical protein
LARIDDYQATFELAAHEFGQRDLDLMSERAGVVVTDDGRLEVDFLNTKFLVGGDPVDVVPAEGGPEPHLTVKGLVMHYLLKADGTLPRGEWITFREVHAADFYWGAFCRRAKDPLVGVFGPRPQLMVDIARKMYNAAPADLGDASVIVPAFPRVDVALLIHAGDDEFPPEGNLLFDANIGHYLSTEDVAVLSGMIVYPMLGAARGGPSGDKK